MAITWDWQPLPPGHSARDEDFAIFNNPHITSETIADAHQAVVDALGNGSEAFRGLHIYRVGIEVHVLGAANPAQRELIEDTLVNFRA